jgi:hypothetical protein
MAGFYQPWHISSGFYSGKTTTLGNSKKTVSLGIAEVRPQIGGVGRISMFKNNTSEG